MEITHKGEKYDIEKTNECFALKNETLYKCWKTKRAYLAGSCLARLVFVLDEKNEVLAEWLPMCKCSGDYELINRYEIERSITIVNALEKLNEEELS